MDLCNTVISANINNQSNLIQLDDQQAINQQQQVRFVTSNFNNFSDQNINNKIYFEQHQHDFESEEFKTCYNQSKRIGGNVKNNSKEGTLSGTTRFTGNAQNNHFSQFSKNNFYEDRELDNQVNFMRRYRILTQYNQEKHEGIQIFVESLRRLEDLGMLKNIGTDCNGTQYFILFAYKYPEDAQLRIQIQLFTDIVSHSNKKTKQRTRLHPKNSIWKVKCRKQKKASIDQSYTSQYVYKNKDEILLIMWREQYELLKEKRMAQRKVKSQANSYTNSDDMAKALLQGFTKEVLERGDEQYMDFNISTACQTVDVIGRHIYQFQRQQGSLIPDIFLLLVTFFESSPELLKTEGLFRIAASLDKLDTLQIHLQMGNYYILNEMTQDGPHAVANYLKKILKYMGEPLCTYKLYSRFRDLSDVKIEQRADKLKEICQMLPPVNKHVFVFLIKFWLKVSDLHQVNKMTLHNLAIVVTPNLFRPFELTANDLIFASHLVESFKVMMLNYEYIFDVNSHPERQIRETNIDNNFNSHIFIGQK
eukprot:403334044